MSNFYIPESYRPDVPAQLSQRQQQDKMLDACLPDIDNDVEFRDLVISKLLSIWDTDVSSAYAKIKSEGKTTLEIREHFESFEANVHRLMNILWPKETTNILTRRRVTRQYLAIVQKLAHDKSLSESLQSKPKQNYHDLGIVAAADLS